MANFNKAFDITMAHEGGYVNDPDDAGGETYRGISRRFNPTWEGWKIIDECKDKNKDFPNNELDPLVRSFYKERYWNPFLGDELDQIISNEMFDTAVNMGIGRAIKFLQQGLNLLNRDGKIYSDIVEDSSFGTNTLRAYNSLPKSDMEILCVILNVLQGMHYIEYMKKSPTQEKYARGWFKRIEIKK